MKDTRLAYIRLQFVASDGKPVGQDYCRSMLSLRTMDHRTLPTRVAASPDGIVAAEAPETPLQIWLNAEVNGFGFTYLAADNGGRGYVPGEKIVDLNRELAETRLRRVAAELDTSKRAGDVFSPAVERRLQDARVKLNQAASQAEGSDARALLAESLRESLWAGEMLALERARQRIEKRGFRDDFLWEAKSYLHRRLGARHDELFAALFNMANVRFYWAVFEPEEEKRGFEETDETLAWIERQRLTAKGHTLIWFTESCGMPEWMRDRSPEAIKQLLRPRITDIARRYAGRIRIYDVINEAHDWANSFDYSHDQILKFARLGCDALKEGDPKAIRIINCVYPWGDYVAKRQNCRGKTEAEMWGPYEFLQACIGGGVDFDGIGLQMYYYGYDMFEIDLVLERFARLGKPIYVTETGVSSSDQPDPDAGVTNPHGLWHAPWSERIQADWAEQFYTICYSKPFVHETSWWDFVDISHSIPHGGLLNRDRNLTPKEAYHRLLALRHRWETMR